MICKVLDFMKKLDIFEYYSKVSNPISALKIEIIYAVWSCGLVAKIDNESENDRH